MSNPVFTDGQITALVDTTLVLSIISLKGSAFICISSMLSERLRTFAFKLIINLSISNIGVDISYLIGNNLDSSSWKCQLQGFMHVYFNLVGFMFVSAITLTCYNMVVKQDFTLSERVARIHAICWLAPLLPSLLPFTTDNYGDSGAWCTIVDTADDDYIGLFWRFSILYIPLWITIGVNLWMHLKILEHIRRLEQVATRRSSEHVGLVRGESRSLKIIVRLRMYPLILCICWSFATVNRIYEVASGTSPPFLLYLLQYSFQSSNGILNAIAYGRTPSVAKVWRGVSQKLRNHCMIREKDRGHLGSDSDESTLPIKVVD